MRSIVYSYIIKILILIGCIKVLNKGVNIFRRKINLSKFLFFTNLSVLLCFLFYTTDVINLMVEGQENITLLNVKGAIVVYTFITMIIYNFLLVPQCKKDKIKYDYYSFNNILAHIFIPLLVLIDWLFLSYNGSMNLLVPILYIIIPIIYCGVILIRGVYKIGNKFEENNSYYPYFFLNIEANGVGKTLFYILILIIVFIITSYCLIFINNTIIL